MCLTNNTHEVHKLVKWMERYKTIYVYKVLSVKLNSHTQVKALHSPFQVWTYKPGLNISSSQRTEPCQFDTPITHGFHVYLNRGSAHTSSWYACKTHDKPSCRIKIVRFIANIDDLLGVDYTGNVAVFSRLKLPKKEYNKYVKQNKRNVSTANKRSISVYNWT